MRKERLVTITEDNRDKGKTFAIREMSAWDIEKWALRALLAIGKTGVDLPPDILDRGAAGLLGVGIPSLFRLDSAEVDILLAQMMACVTIVPDPANNPSFRRSLVGDDDVEELTTILRLRDAVIELHLGFSLAARLSTSIGEPAANDLSQ